MTNAETILKESNVDFESRMKKKNIELNKVADGLYTAFRKFIQVDVCGISSKLHLYGEKISRHL